jgi:hypothetical protein
MEALLIETRINNLEALARCRLYFYSQTLIFLFHQNILYQYSDFYIDIIY